MQSLLAAVTFLIYFALLAAVVSECETATAPAALPGRDCGALAFLLLCFSLVSAGAGFIRAHFLAAAGQISRNEFTSGCFTVS